MKNFIVNLKKFNRKERFYLIGYALGNKDFNISDCFKDKLEEALDNDDIDFNNELFVAMDYHLDWLYACLYLKEKSIKEDDNYEIEESGITATQEDIDFIIMYSDKKDKSKVHMILIEAKGSTGWQGKQLISKANRFDTLFGNDGKKNNGIIPHFLLMSPNKSNQTRGKKGYEIIVDVETMRFPDFMIKRKDSDNKTLFRHICLKFPEKLQKITRCDISGRKSKKGKYWKIEEEKYHCDNNQ
ncbi:hypothetical protein ACFL6G_05940 [candidate division KSB1 bacterium]